MNQPLEDLKTQRNRLKSQLKDTLPGSAEEQALLDQIQTIEDKIQEHPAARRIAPPFKVQPHKPYLKRLLAITSRLELSGIDRKATGQDVETCLNLGAIYTALLTRSTEHPEQEFSSQEGLGVGASMEREGREHRLSALDQANRYARLVLLGEPGSGKSTFVKFVTMCLAGELLFPSWEGPGVGSITPNLNLLTAPLPDQEGQDEEQQQLWEHDVMLPVFIILRDFAAKGLPPQGQSANAKHLWEFLKRECEDTLLGDYVPLLKQHLQDHGGLILLDGLDEVPEADRRRTQIKQAVEDFALMFPNCRILLTSRTYAYQQQEWKLSGFTETVIAPFTEGQIRRFTDRWYRHIAEVRGMNRENAQGRAELLKRAIFGSDRLYSFAERPLLLTLMASLHAWRGGSLPEKRGELYAEATDLLLDWWERDKLVRNAEGQIVISQPSLSEVLRVGKDRLEQVLNEIAFEAHEGQPELVGTADIPQGKLVNTLLSFSKNKDLKPVRLIEYLSDRAGLLVPRGVGVYSFPHRTFQEYLAASYLFVQDTYPGNVARLARQDPNRWREVVLLVAALGPPRDVWSLVEALCWTEIEESTTPEADAWGSLFAGQAMVETLDLEQIPSRHQSKVQLLQRWLVALLSEQVSFDSAQDRPTPFPVVERALAGNILAHLGDPRPGVGLRRDGLPDILWCEVPAGTFLMGSAPEKDKEAYESEQPQHDVYVSAFQISRYPVTNAQYQAFVEDGGYTEQWEKCWMPEGWKWKEQKHIHGPERYGGAFDLANHSVIGVSWYEAIAFCNWLTWRWRESGALSGDQEIRLPTEAEWEKAARGDDGRIYPWGDEEITPERANYTDTGLGVTSTVGCFPCGTSPYGCEDLAGNVYEWCLDWYSKSYYTESPEENPPGPTSGSDRVIRGGGWGYDARYCRSAFRFNGHPGFRFVFIGFRLLRTPS